MIDNATLGEVNNLIEFMDSEDELEVVTAFEQVKVVKRNGAFFVNASSTEKGGLQTKGTRLAKPPYLMYSGHFVYYPPSMANREFVKTKEVHEIRLNGNTIYSLKKASV